MTPDLGPTGGDPFDETVIAAYLDDATYIERPWLHQAVQAALDDPDCRLLLLTGAPGSGKSAFMAWLARQNPDSLRYFLRRDSITPYRSGDVYTMLESLGHQLAARRPEAFRPAKLAVVIEQRVGEVRAGGSVIGVRVDELVASPFYATAVRVSQRLGIVAGDVAGMEIGRVVTDIRGYPWQELDRIALSGPAEVLAADDPSARVVVVIDALDEAEAYGGMGVMDWLASHPVLPASLRIVVASRPGEFLEPLRGTQGAALREIRIDGARQEAGADVRRFLDTETSRPPLATALQHVRIDPSDFRDRIVRRAAGNFQYAVAVVRGASAWSAEQEGEGLLSMLSGENLDEEAPSSLIGLYGVFMAELRRRTRRRTVSTRGGEGAGNLWDDGVRLVLAVLALCREPLSAAQVAHYSKAPIDDEALSAALAELAPLLDVADGGLRLYHASLAEAITRRGPRTPGVSSPAGIVDPVDWHLRLAGLMGLAGLAAPPTDDEPFPLPDDEYRWRNAVPHLFAAAALAEPRQRAVVLRHSALLLESFDYLHGRILHSGVDGALFDLRAARAADDSVFIGLRDLELLLEKVAGELRADGVPRVQHEFVQLLLHRAVFHGTPSVAQRARDWFQQRGQRYLDVVWLRGGVSRALVRSVAIHTEPVVRLLTLGEDRAVSAGADGRVVLWDVAAGEPLWSVVAHASGVADVAACGRALVTVCRGEPSRVIDVEDGRLRGRLGDSTACLAASVDDQHVVTVDEDGLFRLWHIPSLRSVEQCRFSFPSLPTAMCIVGRTVWAAFGTTIARWDLEVQQPLVSPAMGGTSEGPPERDLIVALIPGDGEVMAVTRRGFVGRSGTGEMYWYQAFRRYNSKIEAASAIGRTVIAATDAKLLLCDLHAVEDVFALDGHRGQATAVTVAAGARRILSADALGMVNIWDLESATRRLDGGNPLLARPPLPHGVAANAEWIVTSGWNVDIWDATAQDRGRGLLDADKNLKTRSGWGHCLLAHLNPEGWLAAYYPGGYGYVHPKRGYFISPKNRYTIHIWFLPGAQLRHAMRFFDEVTALLLTSRGRLITGHTDGSIAIWGGRSEGIKLGHPSRWLSTGREGLGPARHPGAIDILFSVDEQRLVSGSEDGRLQVWERGPSSNDWHARSVEGSPHGARVTGISRVSPDRLSTVDASGTVAVWNESMTRVEATYRFPRLQPYLADDLVVVPRGNTLEVFSAQQQEEPAAALRLTAPVSTVSVLDGRSFLVDDEQHNQLRLAWTDPHSAAPAGYPETGPQDENSLYRWPPVRRRVRWSGSAIAAIAVVEGTGFGAPGFRIYLIFPGSLYVVYFIAGILNRPASRRRPKKNTVLGPLSTSLIGVPGKRRGLTWRRRHAR